jgi:hypothetical protein
MDTFTVTPVKREEEIDIFVDVFPNGIKADFYLVAKPISFRITRPYTVDQPSCSENGPLLTLSVEEAKLFAKELLELFED